MKWTTNLRVLRVLRDLWVLVVDPSLVSGLISSLVLVPELPVHWRWGEEGSLVVPAMLRSLHHWRLPDLAHHQSEVPHLELPRPLESLQRLLVFEGDFGLSTTLDTDVRDLPEGAEDLKTIDIRQVPSL